MKYLLADGLRVKVDNDDYEELVKYRWHIKWRTPNHPYVYRYGKRPSGHAYVSTHKALRLHTILLQAPPGFSVDHRNGDPLDNRRSNLRLATQSQQAQNSTNHKKHLYKGVTKGGLVHGRFKNNFPWRARIRVNGELIGLGGYATPEEAARAYNKAARKYFGEFARLNVMHRKRTTK